MKSNYEQCREAIVKACPDILELKFGCEFKEVKYKLKIEGLPEVLSENTLTILNKEYGFYGERYGVSGMITHTDKCKTCREIKDSVFGETGLKDHDDIKYVILGREPQLADVLRAINIEMELRHEPTQLLFRVKKQREQDLMIFHSWNLSLPLSGQSEECLAFLNSILKQQ